MAGSLEGELHAEATVTSVRFDLVARNSLAIDADLRQRAVGLLLDTGSSP